METANCLREIRKAAGISLGEIAQVLNMTDGNASGYEIGKRFLNEKHIRVLCDYLHCTADELLGRTERSSAECENNSPPGFRVPREDGCEGPIFSLPRALKSSVDFVVDAPASYPVVHVRKGAQLFCKKVSALQDIQTEDILIFRQEGGSMDISSVIRGDTWIFLKEPAIAKEPLYIRNLQPGEAVPGIIGKVQHVFEQVFEVQASFVPRERSQ